MNGQCGATSFQRMHTYWGLRKRSPAASKQRRHMQHMPSAGKRQYAHLALEGGVLCSLQLER